MATRIWTISNTISVSRVFLLVPLGFILFSPFESNRAWAAGIIALGALTDFLDGYLARRLHQVSEVGKVIDPIADKIAVGTVAVFLVILGDVSLWYVVLVLLRDMLILAGGIYIRKTKNIVAQSNWPGKLAVNAIALFLLLSTISHDSLQGLRIFAFWSSLMFMLLSMIVYAQRLFIGRVVERGA